MNPFNADYARSFVGVESHNPESYLSLLPKDVAETMLYPMTVKRIQRSIQTNNWDSNSLDKAQKLFSSFASLISFTAVQITFSAREECNSIQSKFSKISSIFFQ